jgi:hypothetical protein
MSDRALYALRRAEEASAGHNDFISAYERRYRAFRGVLERNRQALAWTSKSTPPYAQHIIETAVTALVEDKLKFRVRPRMKFDTPQEAAVSRDGARAHERLLSWQMEQNRFHEKQRSMILQERLAGMTVVKLRWRSEVREIPRLVPIPRDMTDENGAVIGSYPILTEVREHEITYDGPDLEVVDLRHFFWDQNAVSWEKNEICVHRTYVTPEEIFANTSKDLPAEVRWRNTESLSEVRDFAGQWQPARMLAEQELRRGRVEVWEIWLREKGRIRVYTVANQSVLLNERDSPYWHGEFPFVPITTQQDLFKIGGISQIEKIEELQKMLWTISNLRQDAVLLSTMPMVLLQQDMDDPDSFNFAPYARNLVANPQEVQLWSPQTTATQVSLPTEATIKSDMQNLTGGFPFTSSSEARTIDANTATEASLVAGLAQRSLVTAKTFLNYGLERLGQQMLLLNQQYVRDPVYINVLGINEEWETQSIIPEMLRGAFDFVVEPVSESLLRNERRSEAISLFQTLMQAAQMFAMTGQPLNMKPILEDLLEAFDRRDIASYLFTPPPGQMPMAPQQMGSPPSPTPMPGVTNGQLAAGPQAPSSEISLSPELMNQRMMASGSGRNA